MTTFDKREDAFENKFAHDAELQFKAEARRNKLLGLWAAGLLGKSGAAAEAYAREVVAADFEKAGDSDVFAKVRDHERGELLRLVRELDALPYFRQLEGKALPVVEMEGQTRIMLGSNNYLGLTGDERVMQGAQDALAKYGTGLTGSRFLNGTIPLHLQLEEEIADWMGTDEALVFTPGAGLAPAST